MAGPSTHIYPTSACCVHRRRTLSDRMCDVIIGSLPVSQRRTFVTSLPLSEHRPLEASAAQVGVLFVTLSTPATPRPPDLTPPISPTHTHTQKHLALARAMLRDIFSCTDSEIATRARVPTFSSAGRPPKPSDLTRQLNFPRVANGLPLSDQTRRGDGRRRWKPFSLTRFDWHRGLCRSSIAGDPTQI